MNGTEQMADHWWWRPGWAPGRRFYTWHLTFEGQSELDRLADQYRTGLSRVPGLDLVPDRWLHLTMQGLGFADEIDRADVDAIVAGAAKRLTPVEPFTLEMHRPTVTPEAVRWDPDSADPARVRDAIRAAIGDIWPEVPEPAAGFSAHVTIAYSNSDRPAAPVSATLDAVRSSPATVTVDSAQLIVLGRDERMYEWEAYASVPLGAT